MLIHVTSPQSTNSQEAGLRSLPAICDEKSDTENVTLMIIEFPTTVVHSLRYMQGDTLSVFEHTSIKITDRSEKYLTEV